MYKFIVFLLLSLLISFNSCKKIDEANHEHINVVIRNIGHQILLYAGDSTSVVKPITKEDDKFKIRFDSNFSFQPDTLVQIIDSLISKTLPFKHYLVEVQSCKSKQVVYSYEVGFDLENPLNNTETPKENDSLSNFVLVPCQTRTQPNDCYEISIDFLSNDNPQTAKLPLILIIIVLLFFSVVLYFKKIKSKNENQALLGKYTYDSKNMKLVFNTQTYELTSKENELLMLLFESANETVNRETILKKVWEDDGDYIGRTLDVYISKLRKKLELDPTIKLINVRGIGYKLII